VCIIVSSVLNVTFSGARLRAIAALDEYPSPEPSLEGNAGQERDGTCAGEPRDIEGYGNQQKNCGDYVMLHISLSV
jgi:hypothetical protein